MSSGCTLRVYTSDAPYEDDVAHLWWTLSPGSLLPLNNGDSYQLVFPGRPGGSMGPDVRDAVFCTVPQSSCEQPYRQNGVAVIRYAGDVEFHVRASDWFVHQHHSDPRYNNVLLHVVLICDHTQPIRRQDGVIIPVCSLRDLSSTLLHVSGAGESVIGPVWPCHQVLADLSSEMRDKLLMQAGLLRFEQKVHAFVEQVHTAEQEDRYDSCLLPALAESLGYGRDRDFFRAAGLHLLLQYPHMPGSFAPGRPAALPEPLGRAMGPAPLDVQRLRALSVLVERWRQAGIWQTCYQLLHSTDHAAKSNGAIDTLRSAFAKLGLSPARTAILVCNVVLPFAAAVGLVECDSVLVELAEALYREYPGLPANRITRMMQAQLLLEREPYGACRQQGLHYIYQQTCREKSCAICLCGKSTML